MPAKKTLKRIKKTLTRTALQLKTPQKKGPDEVLGHLFHEVQIQQIYSDGKTFVDLVPKRRLQQIRREYQLVSQDPNFHLADFVKRHFYELSAPHSAGPINSPAASAREHVSALWPQLIRSAHKQQGSLIALPYDYVVPGGRFLEQFYWDSYFIMLGLAADKRWDLVEGMMKNYTYMIRKFGYIPTANRNYFISRSQPPFFAAMVKLLAKGRHTRLVYLEYLPALLAEYRFWMRGQRKLSGIDQIAYARVVAMPGGEIMARYYDNKTTPRPESRREDIETAAKSPTANKQKIFLDLRAGAESGWDFSSRWFRDATNIETIHTTDIVPIDLNCLLYELEMTIAHCYKLFQQSALRKKFANQAAKRAAAIRKYCWNQQEGFFYDYDFRLGVPTKHATLAAVFPLYVGLATKEQAAAVAEHLEQDFLREGGLVTTLTNNGQQWDAPNGWAPLQWVAIQGLRKYGYHDLANEIKQRWMASVETVFEQQHKMIEKYDLTSPSRMGGGGEYPLQDGFGWTNGVYAALHDEKEKSTE